MGEKLGLNDVEIDKILAIRQLAMSSRKILIRIGVSQTVVANFVNN